MKDAAFGIVPILRSAAGEWQFLLIQHHAGHWGFPKGHAEAGETAIETALRELREETGVQPDGVLEDTPFVEEYWFEKNGERVEKTVTYFVGWVQSEKVECQVQEIQAYAWVNFETAIGQITFEQGRNLLQRVDAYLQAHPVGGHS
jgi:bis(5'-nucleosidyl)-tetraphosphatase